MQHTNGMQIILIWDVFNFTGLCILGLNLVATLGLIGSIFGCARHCNIVLARVAYFFYYTKRIWVS